MERMKKKKGIGGKVDAIYAFAVAVGEPTPGWYLATLGTQEGGDKPIQGRRGSTLEGKRRQSVGHRWNHGNQFNRIKEWRSENKEVTERGRKEENCYCL